ncbi:MAG: hypothetical protein ABSE46_24955 [Terracidiphilus sp.]|jgi:hypothetical protein
MAGYQLVECLVAASKAKWKFLPNCETAQSFEIMKGSYVEDRLFAGKRRIAICKLAIQLSQLRKQGKQHRRTKVFGYAASSLRRLQIDVPDSDG